MKHAVSAVVVALTMAGTAAAQNPPGDTMRAPMQGPMMRQRMPMMQGQMPQRTPEQLRQQVEQRWGNMVQQELGLNDKRRVLTAALAEGFTLGVKAGMEPLALFESIREGMIGRRRTFDGLIDQFLTRTFEPAAFTLRLAHKDVALAPALARGRGVPMRLTNLTLEEMTEALNRGWGELDTRAFTMLQQERAGVRIAVDPERLKAALVRGSRSGTEGT